jgi:antitoxin component YwqK of YwqJK toxin-antitoxin module
MKSIVKIKKNRVDRKGRKQGCWEYYYPNGQLSTKGSYNNDMLDGIWEFYHEDGDLYYKGSYVNGLKDGMWEYYQNSILRCEELYENGDLIKFLK